MLRLDLDLGDDGRLFGMADIEHADAHRPGLVREIEHATSVGILPDRQAFAALARAVEVAAADDLHVGCGGGGVRILGDRCIAEQTDARSDEAEQFHHGTCLTLQVVDARAAQDGG